MSMFATTGEVSSLGNTCVIQTLSISPPVLEFPPVFGSIYDRCIARSRYWWWLVSLIVR